MRPAELLTDPTPTTVATRIYEAIYKFWKKINNQAIALIYSIYKNKSTEGIEEERIA